MTHLEYATPAEAEKVNKGKYFEKMSKLLNKKIGKKLTIHVIDKISMLKGSNNKPFPFFGKVDPKKSPEWAEKLKQEANMGKCLLEKKSDGSLEMQIKIKGCKKQQELVDFMANEGIKVRFVEKLMKDGKELSDDDKDDDDEDDVTSDKADSAKDTAKEKGKDADKTGKESLQVGKEIDSIKKQISPLLTLLQTEMPKMKGQPINDDLKSKGEQASQLITNFLKLWDTADDTVKTVNKEFKKTIDGFIQFWDKVMSTVVSGAKETVDKVAQTIENIKKQISPLLSGLQKDLPKAKDQPIDKELEKRGTQASQLITDFLKAWDSAEDTVKATYQDFKKSIDSFMQFWDKIMANTIKSDKPEAGKTTMTKEESRAKIDSMKENIQKMKDAIKKFMSPE